MNVLKVFHNKSLAERAISREGAPVRGEDYEGQTLLLQSTSFLTHNPHLKIQCICISKFSFKMFSQGFIYDH